MLLHPRLYLSTVWASVNHQIVGIIIVKPNPNIISKPPVIIFRLGYNMKLAVGLQESPLTVQIEIISKL